MSNFFGTNWPLACAIMNPVSDGMLAFAVGEAGALPSLFLNWNPADPQPHYDHARQYRKIQVFQQRIGNRQLLVNVPRSNLTNDGVLKIFEILRPSHVEIWGDGTTHDDTMEQYYDDPTVQEGVAELRKWSHVGVRLRRPTAITGFSFASLKSSASAGLQGELSAVDFLQQQLALTPDLALCPMGGVGTAEQVAELMSLGAAGIQIGTRFAASRDSSLPLGTKKYIVDSDSKKLIKTPTTGQSGLIGDELYVDDDWNHSRSLQDGKMLYASSAIDSVKRISSAEQIVNELVAKL